jgi:hypothetical protein
VRKIPACTTNAHAPLIYALTNHIGKTSMVEVTEINKKPHLECGWFDFDALGK